MKTKYTFLLFSFFVCLSVFSQQGINYKALIKNNLGNVVANQTIRVKFSILENTTTVYTETHTPTTNENGLIIINIGEGTTTDNFTSINWGNDTHFLKTEIDITGGTSYTAMGTTQFMAVPYALNAANVSGLEALDEGSGHNGWRIKGRNPVNYGNIGVNAIDLSTSFSTSSTNGATGNHSIAMGYNTEASSHNSTAMGNTTIASGFNSTAMGNATTASGYQSTAMGSATTASGYQSTAMGLNTTASGLNSTAMGYGTEASGSNSVAMGFFLKAESQNSTVIGRYNIGGGTADAWVAADPIFEVGNGLNPSNKSNALTILKNGTIIAPSFDISEVTHNKALITKEYADANLTASGLEVIDEGNGVGWRLVGRNEVNYGDIGINAIDLSNSLVPSSTYGATGSYSTAMGGYTIASGSRSIAMGHDTEASGVNSTAMGYDTEASGDYSMVMGNYAVASGLISTAMGYGTEASGNYSTAMGFRTVASSYSSTAMGRYNIGGGAASLWLETDPLFEIGNGLSSSQRANALTILKNGNTGIFEATPDTRLHLKHANNGSASTGFKIENQSNNYWRFYVTSATDGDLRFYSSVNGGAQVTTAFDGITGAYFAISDRRHKTNFKELHFDWESFSKLQPLNYRFKKQKDDKFHLGMIAQDVEKIYPELVSYNKDEDLYQLDYSGFGVVAIKAIQEQQKIITTQADKIKQLEAALLEKEEAMNNLSGRIEKIEAFISNGLKDKELTQNRN